ncbi:MAG: hypothetical protein PVF34_11260 [Gammaproteobacteria bacterium]|jgi:hypothetical protein
MQTEYNREWWKMKVYDRLSEYLKHPSDSHRQQLNSALAEYEMMFAQFTGNSNEATCFSDMELSMNEY